MFAPKPQPSSLLLDSLLSSRECAGSLDPKISICSKERSSYFHFFFHWKLYPISSWLEHSLSLILSFLISILVSFGFIGIGLFRLGLECSTFVCRKDYIFRDTDWISSLEGFCCIGNLRQNPQRRQHSIFWNSFSSFFLRKTSYSWWWCWNLWVLYACFKEICHFLNRPLYVVVLFFDHFVPPCISHSLVEDFLDLISNIIGR